MLLGCNGNLCYTEAMNDSQPQDEQRHASRSAPSPLPPLFGRLFTEKEQKNLFLYLVICIVLLEFAVTVGALIYSFTGAQRLPSGMMQVRFPWIGYLVGVVLAPVLVMLVLHLLSLGFSKQEHGRFEEAIPSRAASFFALVRGAPAVILFAAFVLMGAAIYYLDGVMALLLKLGDSFGTIAIWFTGAFAAAWTVSYAVRAYFAYKSRQMDAEYAFRRDVLERTGMIMLDAKHAPDARLLPVSPEALPPAAGSSTPLTEAIITVEPQLPTPEGEKKPEEADGPAAIPQGTPGNTAHD